MQSSSGLQACSDYYSSRLSFSTALHYCALTCYIWGGASVAR